VGELGFEWDRKKARSNEKKHGVSFEEAQTVFSDENGLLLDDPDHSEREARYLLLGMSSALRILVVSHTLRGAMPSESLAHANRTRVRQNSILRD
jgi:uncharacterized DUF497 family protein